MNPGLRICSAHLSALAAAVRLASLDVAVVGSSIPSPHQALAVGVQEASWKRALIFSTGSTGVLAMAISGSITM